MHPTALPPPAEEARDTRVWWVPGLVWWSVFLAVLVVAVQECG